MTIIVLVRLSQLVSAAIKASGLGVESILLIIVCIVLAGVLGLIGFMFLKLRRLQVDPAAYDDLQGRCECATSTTESRRVFRCHTPDWSHLYSAAFRNALSSPCHLTHAFS